jgi:ESF2/ABP1 family protein
MPKNKSSQPNSEAEDPGIQSQESDGDGSDEEVADDNYNFDDDKDSVGDEQHHGGPSGEDSDDESLDANKTQKPRQHRLSLTEAEDFNKKLKRRGVIYIARVPPRMTPTKLKIILSDFGEVTRLYLVEEDKSVRKRRRKLTGNASKRYTEGWIEFAKKSVAKSVALTLHNTPISNHKRNTHYGDLWCLKYLHKFQWSHLTEKVAYERRVREQKLRLETMQARKEVQAYKRLVETGQKINKIEERKRRREEREGKAPDNEKKKKHNNRQFKELRDESGKPGKKSLLAGLV